MVGGAHHLLPYVEFEASVGEWLDDFATGLALSSAIECMENSMIAATFNTFTDETAQLYFERSALPM